MILGAAPYESQGAGLDGTSNYTRAMSRNCKENPQQKAVAKWITEETPTRRSTSASLHNLKPIFFDHRICQDFLRNPLQLRLGLLAIPSVQIQNKKLPLPHILHRRITQPRQRVLNRLPLRIKHGSLRHHPNMCFHARKYSIS